MCMVGIDECPECEREYVSKNDLGSKAQLMCSKGHTWIVRNTDNIGDFYPELAT